MQSRHTRDISRNLRRWFLSIWRSWRCSGIPDLQATLVAQKVDEEGKGAPTIPETLQNGKNIQEAWCSSPASNSMMLLMQPHGSKNNSFELADRRSGRAIDSRSMRSRIRPCLRLRKPYGFWDYDQAVKFYDRFGDSNNYATLIVR